MNTETIVRPNGRVYTPRKGLRQIGFEDENSWTSYVAVLGTHDIEKARAFGSGYWSPYLVEPRLCWVKSVMRNGQQYIATDAYVHGAAAVVFIESDDPDLVASVDTSGRSRND